MSTEQKPQDNEPSEQVSQPVTPQVITLEIHDAVMTQEQFFGDYLEKGLKDG